MLLDNLLQPSGLARSHMTRYHDSTCKLRRYIEFCDVLLAYLVFICHMVSNSDSGYIFVVYEFECKWLRGIHISWSIGTSTCLNCLLFVALDMKAVTSVSDLVMSSLAYKAIAIGISHTKIDKS